MMILKKKQHITKKHEKLPSRQIVNIQPTVTKNKVAVLQLDIDMNCTCLTVNFPMLKSQSWDILNLPLIFALAA